MLYFFKNNSLLFQSGITCAHIAAQKGSVAVIKGLMKFDPKLVTTARSKVSLRLKF